ncbi:rRNA-processing protein [Mactra antiquata]
MSIIPCVTWVRRGKAKSKPEKLQIAKEDLQRIIQETEERLEDEEEASDGENTENAEPEETALSNDVDDDVAKALAFAKQIKGESKKQSGGGGGDDVSSRYNMDNYDKEDDDWTNPLKGIGGLSMYASNEDDPFISEKNEEDSDEEDFEIKTTDNLLIAARAESEFCSMETHVYNTELDNFYVHHDTLLSTFPLTIEWMDYDLRDGNIGNFVAVGTMDPTIDIWDLDLVDSLEPLAVLGDVMLKKKKKKGIMGHKDAVLDLSWNTNARHVLASASADNTVGLWDLTEGRMSMVLKQHKDKVQCVKWHPVEEHILLSGSFDKSVKMFDCRTPDSGHKTWNMNGEIEKVLWNQFSPINFFASIDNGNVFYMDSRSDKPVYTLSAHTESVTGLCLSCEDSRMLVTSSVDRTVKVWDISDNKPSLIHSQDLKLGQIHSMSSCPDAPYVVAIGGEKNLKVWDLRDIKDVLRHFCPSEVTADDTSQQEEASVTDDMNVAMETENDVAMETESAVQASGEKKKKKKKKKKPKNNK